MQSAIDPSNPNLSVTQFYEALVEQLGLEVEKSEWKTELVFDGQGKAVLNKDGTQKRKKYKLRRISSDSWQLFEMFGEHRQKQVASSKSLLASEEGSLQQISKQQSIKCDRPWRYAERNRSVSVTNQAHSNTCDLPPASCDLINDNVPTTPQKLYETEVGWNTTQFNMGQGIEGSFSAQKLEEEIAAEFPNVNESSSSINTQITESNDVPTFPQNLYKSDGGWNTNQSQNGQRVEGDLSSQKMEPNQRANAERRNSNLASSNEQPISTTTQASNHNLVPTTTKKLYENGAGWNTNQSHTEQEIKGNFLPRKIEPTNLEIQACLKQLRQVSTADDSNSHFEINRALTPIWEFKI
jgi:hypothetical protein